MGKGIIKSGGTGGQYTVDLVYDNSVATARKQTIQADIDDLDNNQIPAATTDKDNAQTTYNNAANDLNAYIAFSGPVTVANAGEYQRQSAIVLNARAQYEFKLRFLNNLILRRNSLAAELNKLNTNTSDTETITAWCADLTEDLSGTVGLIEVGYERDTPVAIIRPHALESAAYNAAKDGINTNFYNQTAHQIYTNRAYLPAMAKWKPRYRIGTLTAKSGDTGSVSLDALNSSQQSIDVNQSTTLTNVQIQYMTCNGDAFDVGDRVVVEFNNSWSTPRIIGFESNPKKCQSYFNAGPYSYGFDFLVNYTQAIIENPFNNSTFNDFIAADYHEDIEFVSDGYTRDITVTSRGNSTETTLPPINVNGGLTVKAIVTRDISGNVFITGKFWGLPLATDETTFNNFQQRTIIDLEIENIGIFRLYDLTESMNGSRKAGNYNHVLTLTANKVGWYQKTINDPPNFNQTSISNMIDQTFSGSLIQTDWYSKNDLNIIFSGTIADQSWMGLGIGFPPGITPPSASVDYTISLKNIFTY